MMASRALQLVFLLLCASTHLASAATVVCMLSLGLPWHFGPYQTQQYKLSLQLHAAGYEMRWMAMSEYQSLDEGVYPTVERYAGALNEGRGKKGPPEGMAMGHLVFLGAGREPSVTAGSDILTLSRLNRLAERYGIDAFVSLMDSTKFLWDEPFAVPAVSWLPYHYPKLVPQDVFLLHAFAGVASLAPTMASTIRGQLEGFAGQGGRPPPVVRSVPHIIEGVVTSDALPPRAETRAALGLPEDTYVVLMQGGNYEATDRKGWFTAIRAFALFYQREAAATSDGVARAHLYIHSISSRKLAEIEKDQVAPANVPPQGVPLRLFLRESGLPREAWTLDGEVKEREGVAGLKAMADVCLHPSKTEGFGLNSLECQAVGTPVVTTKFSAMEDFTRYGISVPPLQLEWMHGGEVATPDMEGVAAALREMRARGPNTTLSADAREWVRRDFSSAAVGRHFAELLPAAFEQHAAAANARLAAAAAAGSGSPPSPLYTAVSEEYSPRVDWSTPWTLSVSEGVELNHAALSGYLGALMKESDGARELSAVIVPCLDRDGASLPPVRPGIGDVNPDIPVLINTHMWAGAGRGGGSRHHITATVLGNIRGGIKAMPEGLARFKPKPEEWGHHLGDEREL